MAQIEKLEHSQVAIKLECGREEFDKALQSSYKKNKNRFQVPGFRKGKVPYQLVIKYYGEGVLYEDAIDEIVNPAYQAAVKAGLENCRLIEKREGIQASLTADYTIVGKLQYIFEKNRYTVLEAKYEDNVTFTLLIPTEDWSRAVKDITEATSGQAEPVKDRDCIYGTVDGEAIVFR